MKIEHFVQVKLGTITKGTADVFSYEKDEDDVVVDPNIEKHLAHFGINMHEMVGDGSYYYFYPSSLSIKQEFRSREMSAKMYLQLTLDKHLKGP